MKPFRSTCKLVIAVTVAGLLHLVELANGANEFRRCYNVSEYTHCFDVQYDTTNNQTLTMSFDDARQQCNNLQSTLIIIKDDEINEKLQEFMKEKENPIKSNDVWLDAYRFNDFNVTNRWQWLNKTLPNISASDVSFPYGPDSNYYVAALAFNGNRFYVIAQQPHYTQRYVCEYSVSKCPSVDPSNVRQFDGKCYAAVNESVNWYEARNRCLKGGGDLASFANVPSINFTSWLSSGPDIRYWIGLRFSGYIWKESGEDVTFAKWIHDGDWVPPCLAVCPNCNPSFSWHAKDCNITNTIHVVCHTATTLHTTITSTITTPTALTSSGSEVSQHNNSSPPYESSDSATSKRLAIGIGVGVGVGVPVLIAVIVLVICIVVRKRRHETISSSQSTNRQQREASSMKEREEVGETAYGTVVPSTFSRQAAEANGAHSATEQTVYAPLQIL